MPGDRGDVDDRSLAARQCRRKRTRQGQWHKEVQVKHPVPIFEVAVERTEAFPGRRFW